MPGTVIVPIAPAARSIRQRSGVRSEVRLQRAGERARRRREVHGDGALEVQAVEVVDALHREC